MEEKKQGKGLIVTLVLFILTTLVACGYIVYDKVLTKDNNVYFHSFDKDGFYNDRLNKVISTKNVLKKINK